MYVFLLELDVLANKLLHVDGERPTAGHHGCMTCYKIMMIPGSNRFLVLWVHSNGEGTQTLTVHTTTTLDVTPECHELRLGCETTQKLCQ